MTSDCPTAEFVGSSWRRDQHARRGSQHCMHCHSAVNARDCTSSHCHSTSNTRAARPHTATRRRAYRNGTLRAEWQCHSHCHSMVNVPRVAFKAEWQCNRYDRGRVAVKGWGLGTFEAEWQCISHCHSPVNVRDCTFKAEWQCGQSAQGV